MSAVQLVRRDDAGEAAERDDTASVAAEFLRNYPRGYLLSGTALALALFLLVGGADWLAVFHLMSLKFTDAMGNPIGDTAGLVAMSGVTLIAYALIGFVWGRPERSAKLAAIGLYAVVLVLLLLAIAPVETGNIREVWAGLTGGGAFGAGNAAEEAPAWFVLPCLTALAVAFSLFGLVFLVCKAWVSEWLALWRCRACALATLRRLEAREKRLENVQRQAEAIAVLDAPAAIDTIVAMVLRQGETAYRAALDAQIDSLQAELKDVRLSKAEKQSLTGRLESARACRDTVHS